MSKIKNVIFDIGNVLASYNYKAYIKSLGFSDKEALELSQNIFECEIWVERDRGGKSDDQYKKLFSAEHHILKQKSVGFIATF